MTLEEVISRECDIIYHDPDHRENTRIALGGKEPTDTDLARQWFGTRGHKDLMRILWGDILTDKTV